MPWLAYIRVSTDMQAERGLSLEAQQEAIRAFAAQKGWEIAEEFVDAGESAKTADRPEFQRMIRRARTDKTIEGILVHKLDRFARNREDSIIYKALLRREGARVVSVTEAIDENTPAGLLVEGILETVAEFYSANLATEVKKGLFQAVKQGRPIFRTPVGYRRLGKGQIAPDPDQSPVIRLIFELYAKGYGILKIAAHLNRHGLKHPGGEWTNSKVWYVLQNPVYAGLIRYNVWDHQKDGSRRRRPEDQWLSSAGDFEPVIPMELWEEVQAEIRRRRKHPKAATRYLLSGFLRCGRCGSPMAIRRVKRARSNGRRQVVYFLAQCTASLSRGRCSRAQWSIATIERALLDHMRHLLSGIDNVDPADLVRVESRDVEAEREGLWRALTTLDERADRQLQAYEAGVITLDQLKAGQERLRLERERAQKRLAELDSQTDAAPVDHERFRRNLATVIEALEDDGLSVDEKRKQLGQILHSINLDKTTRQIHIRYKAS